MVRRSRLILLAAHTGALGVLAFPADGSALSAAFIQLTPTGPSPSALMIPAGMYPVWINNDQVAHTVVFTNGLCSFQLAPGDYGQCGIGFAAVTIRSAVSRGLVPDFSTLVATPGR